MAADMEAVYCEENRIRATYLMIKNLMVGWDAEDEKGNRIEITVDNLRMLDIEDLEKIQTGLDVVQDFLAKAARKGTSSPTS
ncbi:MAG: hypothetical protein C4519_24395 [Desulfobacteraceae bacterium]|nr:MAG: hypothetical protein C4519_24395 [Desulfobacteraceae bacterium]